MSITTEPVAWERITGRRISKGRREREAGTPAKQPGSR